MREEDAESEGRSWSLYHVLTSHGQGPLHKLHPVCTLNSECSPSPSRKPRGRLHTKIPEGGMKAISVELEREKLRTKQRDACSTRSSGACSPRSRWNIPMVSRLENIPEQQSHKMDHSRLRILYNDSTGRALEWLWSRTTSVPPLPNGWLWAQMPSLVTGECLPPQGCQKTR